MPTEFTSIQAAIGDCSGGEYIIVSPKTGGYTDIHVEITDSTLKDNGDPGQPNWNGSPITIKGYRGTPSASVLQGDGTNPVFFIDGIDVMIRALTIEYGAGKDLSTSAYAGNVVAGGGICACPHSAIIIENCHVQNNCSIQPVTTDNYGAKGGGIYIGPIGSNVPVEGYQVTLSDCDILTNEAKRVTPDINSNCKGGGVYCRGLGDGSSFKYNHLNDNLCEDYGGGLCIEFCGSTLDDWTYIFEGNDFSYNHLTEETGEGSAMVALDFYGSSLLVFVNNLLYENGQDLNNGLDANRKTAVYIKDIHHSKIINNTFANNRCEYNGTLKVKANSDSRLVEFYNNIFYYNHIDGAYQIRLYGGSVSNQLNASFDHNCIQYGVSSIYTGDYVNIISTGTVITNSPSFVNQSGNDYHLTRHSRNQTR